MKKLFEQIVKFGIVGAIAFVIDYAVLFVLVQFLHMEDVYKRQVFFCGRIHYKYIHFPRNFHAVIGQPCREAAYIDIFPQPVSYTHLLLDK